jgi:hypothetical protein
VSLTLLENRLCTSNESSVTVRSLGAAQLISDI